MGSFAANGYGLYYMMGNVSEWCWDCFGGYYEGMPASDPRGAPPGGLSDTYRELRGGSWLEYAYSGFVAYRSYGEGTRACGIATWGSASPAVRFPKSWASMVGRGASDLGVGVLLGNAAGAMPTASLLAAFHRRINPSTLPKASASSEAAEYLDGKSTTAHSCQARRRRNRASEAAPKTTIPPLEGSGTAIRA